MTETDLILANACYSGNIVDAIRILDDPNLQFSSNNQAIVAASSRGHIDIVRIILGDSRFDLSISIQNAIINAICSGNLDIFDLLLKHSRMKLLNVDNSIRKGCELSIGGGKLYTLHVLQDTQFDPSIMENSIIKKASRYSNHKVVEMLLFDHRIVPSFEKDWHNIFGKESHRIKQVYDNIYVKLRKHVCTMMFGMQELDIPTLLMLMVLDELYEMALFLPMYVKWSMIAKIKHFKPAE